MTTTVIPPVDILKVVIQAVKVWASRGRACAALLEMEPVLAGTFGAKTKVKRRKATAKTFPKMEQRTRTRQKTILKTCLRIYPKTTIKIVPNKGRAR
jgi:hypothetical protein